jgi:hypothetical protein
VHPGQPAPADLETGDGSFHEDATEVFHHGFSRRQKADMPTVSAFSNNRMALRKD